MPLIKFSGLVSGMKGIGNGSIFSELRGRFYMRTRVGITTKGSPRWLAQQASFAALAGTWRGLSIVEQDAWAAIVGEYPTKDKFGDIRTPSAFELYMRLNGTLEAAGLPTLTLPLLPLAIFDSGFITLGSSLPGTLQVTWTNILTGNARLNIYATNPVSQGRGFQEGKLKLMRTAAPPDVLGIDITTEYLAQYGVITTGSRIYVRAESVRVATGQSGNNKVASLDIPL